MTASRAWWFVAGLVCAAPALDGALSGDGAPPIGVAEALNTAEPGGECEESREGVSISVRLDRGQVLEAFPADALEVLLANCHDEAGVAAVSAVSFSQHGRRSVDRMLEAELPGRSSTLVSIPLDDIGLTSEPLDFSGSLRLDLRVHFDERSFASAVAPVVLHFHPLGSGWLLYDSTALVERFAEGALTPSAEALRRGALATAAPGTDPAAPVAVGSLPAIRSMSTDAESIPAEELLHDE